jgi:hypothetical protein
VVLDAREQLQSLGSATFSRLRDAQVDVLNGVREHHANAPDLAIELPTGSGKTLIALLLAHEVMEQGGSAVYLTPTRQLANQAAGEAARLGLPADVMEAPLAGVSGARRNRVNGGTTLGIFNYWAYFSEADVVDPPSLLLLDDAHLAEEAIADRYSVVIKRQTEPESFDDLIALIAAEAPGYPVVDDLAADRPEVSPHVQLLAFGDVSRIVSRARPIIEAAAAAAPNIHYPFRRISDCLERCLWLIEPQAITVRPLRFPLSAEPRFAHCGRRVYLSATIGNLHDLRRRLGTPPLVSVRRDTDAPEQVPGRRDLLIVDTAISDEERDSLRDRLSTATPRRVWFCRSHQEAEKVRANRTAAGGRARLLDRDGVALEWFRAAENADLVLAARYDGMDFAYEEGRLAFFPSAPYGTDPFDEFLSANFPRSGFLVRRLAERMTQALGRMTRGDDDWAVCVLENPELARLLSRRDVLTLLPPSLAAEINDALERAEFGLPAAIERAERILTGSDAMPARGDWRRPPPAPALWSDTWADWEGLFGDGLYAGTHDIAIANATRLLTGLGDHALRPWWLYLRAWSEALSAEHDHRRTRRDEALADLGSAVRAAGPTTWYGRVAATANRLRPPEEAPPTQANPFVAFCEARTDPQLERWQRETDEALRSDDHNQVARAWTQVGLALGFRASQPSGGGATDSRWQGDDGIFVWEAKVEHRPGTRLSRREVIQLLGQIEEERQSGQPTHGAFLTHLTTYHDDVGASAAGLVIFSLDAAREVWQRTQAGLTSVAEARRARHEPPASGPPQGWLERVFERGRGAIIGTEEVANAWRPPRR